MRENSADVAFPAFFAITHRGNLVETCQSEYFFTMLKMDSDWGESTKSLALIAGGFVFNARVLAVELGAG